jgi:large subunit ribosomal protein L31
MKADIHPKYSPLRATCSCGNVIETRSTQGGEMHLDVCSACHPFYTGKQKIVDSGGRVERFRRRFGSRTLAG